MSGYAPDKGVRFGRRAAKELATNAIRVRHTPVNRRPDRLRSADPPLAWIKGVVTTAFTACSGLTPGAGAATVYYWNGSAMVADAALTAVPVKNWFAGYTPAVGKHINLYWEGGVLWLGPGDC